MRLATALVSIFFLGAAGPARAQEPKDLDTAFKEGVDAVLAGDGKAAAVALGDVVDNRWGELNPRGRHGAATLLMFALVLDGREEEACARGATLYGAMPEIFYSLGKEHAQGVAGALSVLSVRTGKSSSLLYVHNASDKDIRIEGTRYEVSFGFRTSSTSVGDVTTDGSPAFPKPLVLPAGRGTIVRSGEAVGGLLALAVADVVCVLAAQAKTMLPGWIHLTMENYSQTLARLRIVAAKVRSGDEELTDFVLFDFTAEKLAEGGGGEGE